MTTATVAQAAGPLAPYGLPPQKKPVILAKRALRPVQLTPLPHANVAEAARKQAAAFTAQVAQYHMAKMHGQGAAAASTLSFAAFTAPAPQAAQAAPKPTTEEIKERMKKRFERQEQLDKEMQENLHELELDALELIIRKLAEERHPEA